MDACANGCVKSPSRALDPPYTSNRVNNLSAAHHPSAGDTSILVVDDEEDIREFLQELLAGEGCTTAGMPNGQLALEWLASSPDVPALILLDLMMPEMDGWQFLDHADQEPRLRGIPIAIMSAHPSVRNAYNGRGAHFGAFFLLPKPIDVPRLLAIVAGVMPPVNAPL